MGFDCIINSTHNPLIKQKMKLIHILLVILFNIAALHLQPARVDAREQNPDISDIIITTSDSHLLLYSTVKDSFTAEMLKGVHNGIPMIFTFTIKLEKVRNNWPDKTLMEQEITHTLTYDTLKEEYHVDMSERKKQAVVTDSLDKAMETMAELSGIKVIEREKLIPDAPYALHIQANLVEKTLPWNIHYILPFVSLWDIETDWRTVEFRY